MGSPESHPKPPLPKTRERHRAHQEGGSGTHYAGSSSSLKEGLLETHHASRSRQPSSSHAANSSRGPVRSSLQRGMMWVVALALCSFCFLETWRRVSFLVSYGPDDPERSFCLSLTLSRFLSPRHHALQLSLC